MTKKLKLVLLAITGLLLIACAVFFLREHNRQKAIETHDYLTLEPDSKISLAGMELNELPNRLMILLASGWYRPDDPDIAVLDEVAAWLGDGLYADYLTCDDSNELHFAYHSETERYVLSYYDYFQFQSETPRLAVKAIAVNTKNNKNTYVNFNNQEILVNPPESWIAEKIPGH